MENITVAVLEPEKPLRVEMVENTLEALQTIVGGYIECVDVNSEVVMLMNEEGKLLNLPPNFSTGADVIVGTAVFAGKAGKEFASISEVMLKRLKIMFGGRNAE